MSKGSTIASEKAIAHNGLSGHGVACRKGFDYKRLKRIQKEETMRRGILLLSVLLGLWISSWAMAEHTFNGVYTGANLNRIAFPIGGIGSGMYCLEGTGAISHMSVRHQMEFFHEPTTFAAICVKGEEPVARVVEGPIPDWKYFGRAETGNGAPGSTYGLPRFQTCEFSMRFPFCTISLTDENLPLTAEITGFSPFIPTDEDASSLPAGVLEYTFTNRSDAAVEAVFSMNSVNFMGNDGVSAIEGGFKLNGSGGSFAFVAMDEPTVAVDHCWFRGGWWDALTMTWNNIQNGRVIDNPPVTTGNVPGASLFVPFALKPGQSKTIRLLTCWYVPQTTLAVGVSSQGTPDAFTRPSHGAATGQQAVTGFLGSGLVNTFDPSGDRAIGSITSQPFTLDQPYLHFLVGGGKTNDVGVSLLIRAPKNPAQTNTGDTESVAHTADVNIDVADDHSTNSNTDVANGEKDADAVWTVVKTSRGNDQEALRWETWELAEWEGQEAKIVIFDHTTEAWGHINTDHFLLSDRPLDPKRPEGVTLADFEGEDYGVFWMVDPSEAVTDVPPCVCEGRKCAVETVPTTYVPWYARQFASIEEIAAAFTNRYDELVKRSQKFSDCMYNSTLPPEVIEAICANLSILKSPTVLRQHDGRIWGWEGNGDHGGCCAGTCTHVWNYAQAIPHLFPVLERSIRWTEFHESQTADGKQAFRANLPISPGGVGWEASDGQLGGIMKIHREWRISGDDEWLKLMWPAVRQSLEYCIRTWDPRETGLLEESHHNTYDINYLGPEGHCGSFYLGALAAAARMSEAVGDGDSAERYRALLAKGRVRMETELFNGEYFVQLVPKPGKEGNPNSQSEYYRAVAEQVDAEGPKYQYGEGCLSDGVLGLWMAKVCGIDEDLVDPKMVLSHLESVYRYNLKRDLSAHANPQRPSYAMGHEGGLLLCSWPHGGKPLLPFVYSDEVWTGIEYQVASHLIFFGKVREGLEIVRECRERYDGVRRNPLNEYECGHWYARAMASFALLQSLHGVRYDAVGQTLEVPEGGGQDFRIPLFTATGFGMVERTNGKVTYQCMDGTFQVREIR